MILKICVLTLLVFSRNYIARTEGAAISPLPSFFANIEKRRCISRPNLAYLFPINSGHSVKISTPGHQMSGQQVTLCDLISTHFGNFAVCSSNSRRYSDLKLTSQSVMRPSISTIFMSQILPIYILMSYHFC